MSAADLPKSPSSLSSLPASLTAEADTPWVPLGPGRSFKPIRFFKHDSGYVALMRVEPGVAIPAHRHTGAVHALNIEGHRELHTGEVVNPGDYVFEPPGNIDTWRAIGDQPAIVFIIVEGAVEYLDAQGEVLVRYSAKTQEAAYQAYCASRGLVPRDLHD